MSSSVVKPLRILIIGKESILVDDFPKALHSAGYEIVGIARSAFAALRLAYENAIDVIIADVSLHSSDDGFKAAIMIRQIVSPKIPFILISTFEASGLLLDFPLSVFLRKPVNISILLRKLKKLLSDE